MHLVLHVLPMEEYGVQPDDGPEGWDEVATCLWACGQLERGVLEAWTSREQAERRVCELLLEESGNLRHVLAVRRIEPGRHVHWWPR